MIKASFNGVEFKNIEGYRIACCLKPSRGFGGQFFVYIEERRQAQTPFETPIKVSVGSDQQRKSVRGTLSIKDEYASYDFEEIDLVFVEHGATRRERTRYLEFHYDEYVTGRKNEAPITIKGINKAGLGPSALGNQYMGGIGVSRHLLGFKAAVSANDGTVVRFYNLGCMEKSFLEKIVELNKEIRSTGVRVPPFTVNFSQGDLEITNDNLEAFYVEESYGSLSLQETPSVFSLLESTGGEANPERLRPYGYLADELLWHDSRKQFKAREVHPGTVETATLVLKSGKTFDLDLV